MLLSCVKLTQFRRALLVEFLQLFVQTEDLAGLLAGSDARRALSLLQLGDPPFERRRERRRPLFPFFGEAHSSGHAHSGARPACEAVAVRCGCEREGETRSCQSGKVKRRVRATAPAFTLELPCSVLPLS